MKQPVHQKHYGYNAEWLQALFTLAVLASLYQYSLTFDSNVSPPSSEGVKNQTSSYWNESLGYGFRGNDGDMYKKGIGSAPDTVAVSAGNTTLFADNNVRVSFYTDTPISDIEKSHTDTVPRAYSRLPNGIAVIEGDLSSTRAKNVLATLHSR